MRKRTLTAATVVALTAGVLFALPPGPGEATPVAANDVTYTACGRVFSDPHAYWPSPAQAAGKSPFAKGNAPCAAFEFITYQEMIDGSTYLEGLFPDFVEFYNLEEDFGDGDECATSTDPEDYCSAGLPQQGVGDVREREDLYMIRVTDERVSDADKRFFVFPLSIHGIERAGAEAGTRAAEDLATWAYCEAVQGGSLADNGLTNCDQEGAIPHPLLETQPSTSLTAGEVLEDSVIYFMFANPDGWRRGDPDNLFRFYQRYNGNGVDLNRDWPTLGFTFRPYTPWSEPETRGFGQVLKDIRGTWDGGIDLHGQLIDDAFSFTLLGASQRDYAKDQRILQTVKGAWEDAESRLSWSPLIKPNDASEDDPRLYGVQWGTVWDTIDYTVTGSLGDWIDSPLGLGADGIDNEMSLSHLSNCGTGTCYEQDAEQLHVDGNKSLVYSMVNFTLLPEADDFTAPGQVGYVFDPARLSDPGDPTPTPPPGLPTQDPILDVLLTPLNDFTHQFEIMGPDDGVYNGGVQGVATPQNVFGVSPSSLTSLVLEQYRGPEENPPSGDTPCVTDGDDWEEVNRYFNQSPIYLQSGQAVHANNPTPGPWRICIEGGLADAIILNGGAVDLDITFSGEKAWEDPGQLPYDVSNMDFFEELAPYMEPGQLVPVDVDDVLTGAVNLDEFTSVVVADNALPGFTEPIPTGPAQAGETHANPGVGTAPCAYQRGTSDVPGTIEPTPGCFNTFEFDVDPAFNNQQLIATLTTANPDLNDWDLFLDRQSQISGEWFEVGRSTTPSGNERITTFTPPPGHYRVLVVNWSAADATSAQELDISFSNEYAGPPVPPSDRSEADRDAWGDLLQAFVERGGNLVLTDGAVKNLAYMGLFDRPVISSFSVYAGFIGFTRDGQNDTYGDPLAENVNQPGAAEGPQHRHQTYEPVPIGFAIQDAGGADFNSSPVWGVDQATWEDAGGRTVGITTADQVTLGELAVGDGVVRVIGALLPFPTEQYYHPFGLADYALTYTGYQVFKNALQWERETCPGFGDTPGNHIIGTPGPDRLTGTAGVDIICGLGGKDIINGLGGDDILLGGPGNDTIFGKEGNDLLLGEGGGDTLAPGVGTDEVVGGPGTNTVSYFDATGPVTVNLNIGTATGGGSADDLLEVQNIIGSEFSDQLTGDAAKNVIRGRGGDDELNGNNGPDQLDGGFGNDILNGGGGNDLADYQLAPGPVTVDLSNTAPQETGWGEDTLKSMENLWGSESGDELRGSNGRNNISGLKGDDELYGQGGNDRLFGGPGDDLHDGGQGRDFCSDTEGNNTYVSCEHGTVP